MKITVTDTRTAESFLITMSPDMRVSDVRTVISHHLSIPLEYVNLLNPGNEMYKISGGSDFSDESLESLARRISAGCEAVPDEITLYMTRDRVCHPGDAASSSSDPASSSSSSSSSEGPDHPLLRPPSGGNPCIELLGEAKALLASYLYPSNPFAIIWRTHYGAVKTIYSQFDNIWELMIQLYNIRLNNPEGLLGDHIRAIEQKIVDMPLLAWIAMIRNSGNSASLLAVMFRFRNHTLTHILKDKPPVAFELLRLSILSGGVKFREVLECVQQLDPMLTATILCRTDSSSENVLMLAAEHTPSVLSRLLQAIERLPEKARAHILGRKNQDGLNALAKVARHLLSRILPMARLIRSLESPVLKYAIFADASTAISDALIRALKQRKRDALAPLFDILQTCPQYIRIQILEHTDADGFDPLMTAIRYPTEQYEWRLLEQVNALPDTARISIFSRASHSGWNCLMLAAENTPAIIMPLLDIMAGLQPPQQAHFLGQKTHDGWMILRLVARYQPDIVLSLTHCILKLQNPELQEVIFTDAAITINDTLTRGLMGSHRPIARNALLEIFESYPEALKICIMEKTDPSGSNLLMTAIVHAPEACLPRLLIQVNRFPETTRVSILSRTCGNGQNGLLRVADKFPALLGPFMESIALLPAEAQTHILGQRNARGAMILLIALRAQPSILPAIPDLLKPLKISALEELLYENAALEIGNILIRSLRGGNSHFLISLLDTMERIPKTVTICVLEHTDTDGFNPLMAAIGSASVPIQQWLLSLTDSLGEKNRISVLSKTSNNGWNCLMLASENSPALIGPLLRAIARLPRDVESHILGQGNRGGWGFLRLSAYHHPGAVPQILDWLRLKDPTLAQHLMRETGGEIGRAMHRALKSRDDDTFHALLGAVGHFDSSIKYATLSEKDAQENNIFMAAIRAYPDTTKTMLDMIREMEPKHRADILLRENRRHLGVMQLIGQHRAHPEYPRYLSMLRDAIDTMHTPPALPEPAASSPRHRFQQSSDAPSLPGDEQETLEIIMAFMNAMTDNSWFVAKIAGIRRLTALVKPGDECEQLSESLRKDYRRNPLAVDFHAYVEQTTAGNMVRYSCDLSALTRLLQEHHVLAVAQPGSPRV